MIRILFFANLREALNCSSEQVELPSDVATISELRNRIAQRGEPWTVLLTTKNLRAAINQSMSGMDAPVKDGDEIAFFPPVTGG